VEVGRPAPVFVQIADIAHEVALGKGVTGFEAAEGTEAEVAVQSMELRAVDLMAKDHRRAVVAETRIVGC